MTDITVQSSNETIPEFDVKKLIIGILYFSFIKQNVTCYNTLRIFVLDF